MQLSAGQLAHFDEQGYLIAEDVLEDGDLDPVIRDYADHIDRRSRDLHAAGKLSRTFEEEPFERRLARICEENTEIYDDIDIPAFRGRGVFEFLRNDHLMDVVEPIVGPEIICSPIQHTRAKLPQSLVPDTDDGDAEAEKRKGMVSGNVAPWHQDAQVHQEVADSTFILTVWIPLVDATPENGCLQIVPGIHRERTVLWWKGPGWGIDDEDLESREVVTLPMRKGSVLLLHKLIPHRSTPNLTDGIRWSMDLRYQKTGTPTGRELYPHFVTRSRSRPETKYTDYEDWCRRWIEILGKVPLGSHPIRETPLTEHASVSIETR